MQGIRNAIHSGDDGVRNDEEAPMSGSNRTAGEDMDISLNYQSMAGNFEQDSRVVHSKHYRGFATPINGMFADPATERVDCCAMACCGILQSDRDRYLVTGVKPPSCMRRFWLHTVFPLAVFVAAGYCAVRVRDPFLNQMLSTTLVFGFIGVLIIQCFKGAWKRKGVRKDLLWTKHQLLTRGQMGHRVDDDQEDADAAPPYLMGQTKGDLRASHRICACYVTDDSPLEDEPGTIGCFQGSGNICSQLFYCWTKVCCGALCGMNLQCCGICALAQEGRDIERILDPSQRRIDYVTMQPFVDYYQYIFRARHGEAPVQWTGFRLFSQPETDDQTPQPPRPITLLDCLSSLSKTLITVIVTFLILLLVWSFTSGRFNHSFQLADFFILCATLVQALVIVLTVYWKHTQDVSVDALIKFFFCGFTLCTTLAIFFEVVVGMSIRVVMSILVAIAGIDEVEENGFQNILTSSTPIFGTVDVFSQDSSLRASQSYRDFLGVFGSDHPIFYTIYLFVNAFFLAALVEELSKYYGFRMAADHPDFLSARELQEATDVYNELHEDVEDVEEGTETLPRPSYEPVILPFAQQERSARSRAAAVTISMITVSIGFACCENLVYIFLYSDRSLSGELLVLIARSLFPVHPIAAALQSIGVCSRDIEKDQKVGLNRIVFGAVLFHGSYDFFLMWIDYLVSRNGNYVIADDDSVVSGDSDAEMYSLLVSFGMLAAALWYYFHESRKQRDRLDSMDREASVDRSRLL